MRKGHFGGLATMAWMSGALLPMARADAQSVPPGILACASQSDVIQRLSCYDREVARLSQKSPASVLPPPLQTAPAAVVVSPPASVLPPAAPPASPAAAASEGSQRHLTAHVVSVESSPNKLVVHLDNGQVWEQVILEPLRLRVGAGDEVTIDRQFGSYWLSIPRHPGENIKVRLRQ